MPKKILIIDDDIDLVETMRMVLESEGFDVYDAQDGTHGLAKLKSIKPDILILDVMMGSQDEGFHVAYEIKSDEKLKDIPIILVTAVSHETGFEFNPDKEGDFMPVNAYLEKPVNPEKLIEIVKINLGY
jgi:CheY-like chemotaxis protein